MRAPIVGSKRRPHRVRRMRVSRPDATRHRKARAATLTRRGERALKASRAAPDPVRWLTYNA